MLSLDSPPDRLPRPPGSFLQRTAFRAPGKLPYASTLADGEPMAVVTMEPRLIPTEIARQCDDHRHALLTGGFNVECALG